MKRRAVTGRVERRDFWLILLLRSASIRHGRLLRLLQLELLAL